MFRNALRKISDMYLTIGTVFGNYISISLANLVNEVLVGEIVNMVRVREVKQHSPNSKKFVEVYDKAQDLTSKVKIMPDVVVLIYDAESGFNVFIVDFVYRRVTEYVIEPKVDVKMLIAYLIEDMRCTTCNTFHFDSVAVFHNDQLIHCERPISLTPVNLLLRP